jgi:hypothetical protein
MSLSDACFDFTCKMVAAAQALEAAADYYVDTPLKYGDEIVALRKACLDAQQTPWNADAAVMLIRLATSVMHYHDTPPSSPNELKRLAKMTQLIDLLKSDLDESDAAEVKGLLPKILEDTPQTNKAATRLQVILGKVGKATYDVAIKVITDVASEATKKVLGIGP